jgi:hypothetical protein
LRGEKGLAQRGKERRILLPLRVARNAQPLFYLRQLFLLHNAATEIDECSLLVGLLRL